MNTFSPLILYDLALPSKNLIGVDEVGRGCLAGPVYAGAVYFSNLKALSDPWTEEINDSKKLTPRKREELCKLIKLNSFYSLGQASVKEIEQVGILNATLLAMHRAIEEITKKENKKEFLVLVDGISKIKTLKHKQITIKKGDASSFHIAAASIIAKTARDKFMADLAEEFKEYKPYNWHSNAGYGTKVHVQAILKHGPTEMHRAKFLRKIQASSLQQKLLPNKKIRVEK
ncbi:MAG: ribonuclease HII [Candidatus Caenarcaniphilales bacterium]|nr:ribonuclease HII [Candidatus Caenarcaniphilales bacterium]